MRAKSILLLAVVILMPSVCAAQYWGERAAERSFEQSELHFESYYLNPYGIKDFGDIAAGTIDDPFLDLHLNPANLPTIEDGHALFYFDFRGDRNEAPIIDRYYDAVYPEYGDRYVMPDPRYYNVARQEPEPIFSFGVLAYPFREGLDKLFVGATYQIIYKEEPYYTQPFWIYRQAFGYDSFGERNFDDETTVPVRERYYGKDELSTEAHLFSVFTGFPLTASTDFGLGINAVTQTRDGSYANRRSDDYGGSNDWEYLYHEERSRRQDYDHVDISGGLRHALSRETTVGVKIGYLSGDAMQADMSVDSSRYQWGDSLVTSRFNYHYQKSFSERDWKREGHTAYTRLSFEHRIGRDRRVSGYYRYAASLLDLTNSSAIDDTSSYRSQYVYNNGVSSYISHSAAEDKRRGTGERNERIHQGMLNLKWQLDRNSRVSLGAYFSRSLTTLSSNEPVVSDRSSSSYYARSGEEPRDRYQRRFEDKRLQWSYRITNWTIQVPVLLHHRFDEHFALTLGVNRILESWKTSDQTVAYFTRREDTRDGKTTVETNFAERSKNPDEKSTDGRTAFFGSLELAVTPQFSIRLMLKPEAERDLRISQWWLSFRLKS